MPLPMLPALPARVTLSDAPLAPEPKLPAENLGCRPLGSNPPRDSQLEKSVGSGVSALSLPAETSSDTPDDQRCKLSRGGSALASPLRPSRRPAGRGDGRSLLPLHNSPPVSLSLAPLPRRSSADSVLVAEDLPGMPAVS